MTTITIVPEFAGKTLTYKAICGNQETSGLTPGQALDLMETSGSSLLFMLNQQTRCQDNILLTQKFRKFLKP